MRSGDLESVNLSCVLTSLDGRGVFHLGALKHTSPQPDWESDSTFTSNLRPSDRYRFAGVEKPLCRLDCPIYAGAVQKRTVSRRETSPVRRRLPALFTTYSAASGEDEPHETASTSYVGTWLAGNWTVSRATDRVFGN